MGVIVNEPIDAAIGCTASGLPAGLKFAAKKTKDKTFGTVAAGTVYGVPTKAGEYTVYFKKSVKKNGKSVNHQASATFKVAALPKWATGTFVGSAGCKMESAESGEMYGSATMTVGAAGKISGKIALGGTNWTFSATSFSRVEHVERAEGGVETNFVGEAVAKAGKVERAVALEVCGHAGDGGFVETALLAGAGDGGRGATALPNGVASGGFADGGVSLVAWRSVWKDSGMAQFLDLWKGAYDYLTDEGEPLTLTLDANGGVKAAGTLADLRVGVAFRARIDVDPEWHPVKFAAKNLPAGLKLNATTGVISGVPTKAGAKTISFPATSGANAKLASPALKVSVSVAKRGG